MSQRAISLVTTQAQALSAKPYVSKLARKRMQAAQVRRSLDERHTAERLKDKRNRVSERIPMPKPSVIREQLEHGTHYTLLHWEEGRLIGEFAADTEARMARSAAASV